MSEYRIAVAPLELDSDGAIAMDPVVVRVVCEHFAIRKVFVELGGGKGLYLEAFVLDHMPSGYRTWAGPLDDGWTEEGCEAFAKSCSTMPVRWAEARARQPDEYHEGSAAFFIAAKKAAAAPDPTSIDYADHESRGNG